MLTDKMNSVGIELKSLSHRIHRFTENSESKKKLESVSGTNGWIIVYLYENRDKDIFQKDIEKEFDVTRSTASKVIDLMEKKGLVERQRVSRDARLRKLVLTKKSEDIAELISGEKRKLAITLLDGFSEDEIELLTLFIKRMKINLEAEITEGGESHEK